MSGSDYLLWSYGQFEIITKNALPNQPNVKDMCKVIMVWDFAHALTA